MLQAQKYTYLIMNMRDIFDHDGIYVVYGSVKNTDNQTVLAKVQITVNNGDASFQNLASFLQSIR